MERPRVIIFASGGPEPDEGGSGFQKLAEAVCADKLHAHIVAVVSNHPNGGVKTKAGKFGIKFEYFPGPWTAGMYKAIVRCHAAEFVLLSGWLKFVRGCDPRKTINIHPGLLPRFGGRGMHGMHVHEETMNAFWDGAVHYSAVSMHFVTDRYDMGPVFFQYLVPIIFEDNEKTLAARVNKAEHYWQWQATEWVLTGKISWDGKNPESLKVDIPNYPFLPPASEL